MGFDMFSERPPDAEQQAAVMKASNRIDDLEMHRRHATSETAAKAIDDQLDSAWNDYEKARTGLYFRLNIWAMGAARHIMREIGMIKDAPAPQWPTLAEFDLTHLPEDPRDHPEGPKRTKIEKQLTTQQLQFLAAYWNTREGDAGLPAIPAYKLMSNDGWLVTERETTAALHAWESVTPEAQAQTLTDNPWWLEWLDFLEYNATRGGFRVH
ncbi:hypothetical protein DSC45_35320 [Streptomyces sp. YIM 130001]|uniref:hypothetical protein n=1 Tax=Streptomyces sp. YIM 130001 TaxID=2259644 RepID=UPI000E64B2E9|nr:hypothetical protein [Streptomyces sp. YIM 130001]RII06833.1 hypothetical protein DSC45_35320 [Streptomyces sp. YIM 130001]